MLVKRCLPNTGNESSVNSQFLTDLYLCNCSDYSQRGYKGMCNLNQPDFVFLADQRVATNKHRVFQAFLVATQYYSFPTASGYLHKISYTWE